MTTMLRALLSAEHPAPRRVLWPDAAVTALVGAVSAVLAVVVLDGEPLDAFGWLLLLVGCVLPLAWRRRWPMGVLLLTIGVAGIYHANDYNHTAPIPATFLAIFAVAAAGPRRRTLAGGLVALAVTAVVWTRTGGGLGMEALQVSGWILAIIAFGEAVRIHREYLGATTERAERAERTREEEAARRVAEERLRIARDLHDLLAHSITLIGVQTSVASHVLIADPERLDRQTLSRSLDGIAETCRGARAELRSTLEVLRADSTEKGPLPGMASLPDLVRAAEAGGAEVTLSVRAPEPLPPAVAAAAYRIVQESLTNAVRHAGPEVRVRVGVRADGPRLRVTVTDDGPAGVPAVAPAAGGGFSGGSGTSGGPVPSGASIGYGLIGMRERARSVGGTLAAGPRTDAPGFAVAAVLPLPRHTGGEYGDANDDQGGDHGGDLRDADGDHGDANGDAKERPAP